MSVNDKTLREALVELTTVVKMTDRHNQEKHAEHKEKLDELCERLQSVEDGIRDTSNIHKSVEGLSKCVYGSAEKPGLKTIVDRIVQRNKLASYILGTIFVAVVGIVLELYLKGPKP